MIEPFQHNSWATLRLLEFLREIDPVLLEATAPGAYGSIRATLAHLVGAEETLAAIVEGVPAHARPRFTSVDDLHERAIWLRHRWERCLGGEQHPERLVERERYGSEPRLIRVGTVLAQVVYSGNHYRAQICMILARLDIEPPALDAWAYGAQLAERTDRGRWRRDAV
jgi:uncharacterized damage-inducible protein DinB